MRLVSNASFDIQGLREFEQHLISVALKDTPQKIKKFLGDEGNELKKRVRARAKQDVGKVTGNYEKGWKRSRIYVTRNDDGYGVLVYNAAPHSHLIEKGHRQQTKSGEVFVKGKFVLEKTVKDYENDFYADCSDLLDDIIKEIET